jgi:uncharacterized protein (TIGR04255 family)
VSFDFGFVPEEVPLKTAPLVRVLCQIRYSPVPELVDDESERALASLLEGDYPIRGLVQGVVLPLPGMATPPSPEHFRTFEDTESHWKVTLAPDFIGLETGQYDSRKDFLERLEKLLDALGTVRRPPKVTRVGMRYTDRIVSPQGLKGIVRPSLLGILPELTNPDEVLNNQVVQALLNDPESGSHVQVRSLCLPPNVLFDPSIQPVASQSWVLDIDAFNESSRMYETKSLVGTVSILAERAYQVFYWSVTDEFRTQFGAEIGVGA